MISGTRGRKGAENDRGRGEATKKRGVTLGDPFRRQKEQRENRVFATILSNEEGGFSKDGFQPR